MRETVANGLRKGATMASAAAAAMMIASTLESGSPWAGLNAIGAGGRRPGARFDPLRTPLGLGLLTAGLLAWGVLHEETLPASRRTRRRSGLAADALSAALGYAFNRLALPSWVVPKVRRPVGPRAPASAERRAQRATSPDWCDEAAAIQRPPADS